MEEDGENESEDACKRGDAEAELVDYLKRNHGYTGERDPYSIRQCVVNDNDLFDAYVMPWFVPLSPTTAASTKLEQHLRQDGFVVLSFNQAEDQFEAWAYQGPLDFDNASPVRFGIVTASLTTELPTPAASDSRSSHSDFCTAPLLLST